MFLSRFHFEFQKLDAMQQQYIFELLGVVVVVAICIVDVGDNNNDDNDDSTVPPLNIPSYGIMRAVTFHWRTTTIIPERIILKKQIGCIYYHTTENFSTMFMIALLVKKKKSTKIHHLTYQQFTSQID